uniref:Dynamin GTPase n=1 Tax=Arcella intermedia TaxID=1963864 RepID=A0A6B2KZI7_9EUKA
MMNKVQEIFALTGTSIDLPQIVVVGGQSSGKSSVLENLVGKDFLPRGNEIVTRRPLILQLHRLSKGEQEYGEFAHQPAKKFYNFLDIRKEIQEETDRVAGSNKGISNKAIVLKVYSPHVLNLTLVDTPGIARVPIGDQPKNIETQIRGLVTDLISKNNAIILAVQAANQDLATSDALSMAKSVDSDGSRTIGVLTKLDLMDKGTNALDILYGRQFPLRRGWTAVVNRSQADIESDKSIEKAQEAERRFFSGHPVYGLIEDRCGTAVLANKCNKILTEHIRKSIPYLKKQIDTLIKQRQLELESFGEATEFEEQNANWLLLQYLQKFSAEYKNTIEHGNMVDLRAETKLQLSGSATIRYILHDVFTKKLNEVKPTQGLSTKDILATMENAAGAKPSLFVPDAAFEILAQRQIKWLREPSLQAAEMVFNELSKLVMELDSKELMRFSSLKYKVAGETTKLLRKMLKETKKNIDLYIDIETAYINKAHPNFNLPQLLASNTVKESPKKYHIEEPPKKSTGNFFTNFFWGPAKEEEPKVDEYEKSLDNINEREKAQLQLMHELLDSYFTIVKKNVQDRVTKIIMHFLVLNSVSAINSVLHRKVYVPTIGKTTSTSEILELLREAEDIAVKRNICKNDLQALLEAKKVLSEVNEI